MNMFRNSLNSSLRVLGLRQHGDFGFQSKCWKFFSINNSVQFRKSNGTYTSNNLYEFSEVKDKIGTRRPKSREFFYPNRDIDEEDDSLETIRFKEGDSISTDLSSNIFGSFNLSRKVGEKENENEKEFEDLSCKRNSFTAGDNKREKTTMLNSHGVKASKYKRFENGDMNSGNHFYKNETNIRGKMEENNISDNYRSGKNSEIQKISANVPRNSAILRNVVMQSKNYCVENTFVVKGKLFMLQAIENGVQPLKVFYYNPSHLNDLKFFSDTIEFYKIYEGDMKRHTSPSHSGVIGVFEKDAVHKVAETVKKELPMTVICHRIFDWYDFGVIFHDVANTGSEKFMTTSGSKSFYELIASQRFKNELFTIPVYDRISWNDVDESIDLDHEVFLISPREETSAGNVKKKKLLAIPTADILSTDVWMKKKIFLIISRTMVEEDETILEYCKKWKAKKLILPDVYNFSTVTMASPMLWEIRRQYIRKFFSMNNGEKEENYETF